MEHTPDDFLIVGFGRDRGSKTQEGVREMDCYLRGGPEAFVRIADKGVIARE
jgi:hypothetical protein